MATLCADCDPPVVAISTGNGSRCPRCGQVETWSLLTTDALDTQLDGRLARQIIFDTALRSDGDARLLAELAGRLLCRAARAGRNVKNEEDAEEHPNDEVLRSSEPAVSDKDLITTLGLLANDCEADDRRMAAGPWTYNDDDTEMRGGSRELVLAGGSVGYENARMIVEEHDGLAIAAVRNRLADLVKALREAAHQIDVLRVDRDGYQDGLIVANNAAERRGAKRDELTLDHKHLQRLYKESRDYVATLERERNDLVAGDKRRVVEMNCLDARVEQLEKALAEALGIAEYEVAEYRGLRKHLERLPELRGVLGEGKARP